MPVKIGGHTYYRTTEACRMAGISKATLFRWFESGILHDVFPKDSKGWRLFSEEAVEMIRYETLNERKR